MGADANSASGADDAASKLKRIDELLDKNEGLRRQKSLTSLIGIVVILGLFTIFIYRLYSHGQTVIDQKAEIGTAVWTQTEPFIKQEVGSLGKDLQETAMPELSKAMMTAFKADLPKLEAEGREMGTRLYDHGRQTVEAVLIETLAASLEKSSKDLEDTFPEVSADELQSQFRKSGELFTDRAYEVVEERVARVGTSIDGLKASVKKVADGRGKGALDPNRLDWAEDEVISALVDLVVFELKPELGDEPAEAPKAGGAK